MASRILLVLPFLFPIQSVLTVSKLEIIQNGATEFLQCWIGQEPTTCLEQRTVRQLEGLTSSLKQEMRGYYSIVTPDRQGKLMDNAIQELEDTDIKALETENKEILEKIKSRDSKPNNGLIDEISDLFTYGVAKILNYFSPEKQTDDDLTEKIIEEAAGRDLAEGMLKSNRINGGHYHFHIFLMNHVHLLSPNHS